MDRYVKGIILILESISCFIAHTCKKVEGGRDEGRHGEERRRRRRRREHSPSSNLVLASFKQVLISSGSVIYRD